VIKEENLMISKQRLKVKPNSLKPMIGKFALSKSDTVLDAGCGYGVRSVEIGRDVGAHVISIDLSPNCLIGLKQQKNEYEIDIIRADLQNIPLKDKSVNVIVSGDVLEHIPEVSKTVSDFYRIIKNKGIAFLLVPSSISQKLYCKLDNTYAEQRGHVRIFGATQFKNLISSAGFVVFTSYHADFFRSIYHLLQVLLRTKTEHQTGRAVNENTSLSTLWSISRLLYYSWVGSLIEAFGKFIFPNSFVIIATKPAKIRRGNNNQNINQLDSSGR
jgi:ubiquinone/menaquinone biosynthesis C-methylase UbiE